jgi:hypothetical protein
MFEIILSIVGLLVGIAGLIYAKYQARERKKLEDYVRSQSWYVYSKANNVAGIAQASLRRYSEAHAQGIDPDLLMLMSKTDAFGQELFRETIRQIQLSEPDFSKHSFEKWISEGKLDAEHEPLFKQLCVGTIGSAPKKGLNSKTSKAAVD